MNEFFNRVVAQVREMWTNMTRGQRIWAGVIGIGTLAFLIGISYLAAQPEWKAVGTFDLPQAAQVKAELERVGFHAGVEYRLTNGGQTIEVDARKLYEANLALASGGLLGKSEKGFSIFEKFDITTTDYEQRLRTLEALKSEMRSMIRSYAQVEDVSISVPSIENQSIFTDNAKPQTAAVVLTLKAGAKLDNQQIIAIRNLIAAGFPGLTQDKVELTDNLMRPLTPDEEDGKLPGVGSKQSQIVKETERGLEDNIRKVLGPVLGNDKFSVSAKVEFDWDNVHIAEEKHTSPGFDQLKEGEQASEEKLTGQGLRPGGEPGVNANAPPAYNQIGNVGPVDYSKSEKVINYLSDKTVTERIQSPAVKRISASVAIDGIWKETSDSATGQTKRVYQARSEDEMKTIRALVKSAIGENPDRRDLIEVLTLPWNRDREFEALDAHRAAGELQRKVLLGAPIFAVLLIALLVIYMGWQKSARVREEELARQRELERQRALASAEAGMAGEISLEDQERHEIQRRASSLARAKPQIVADLLRTWIAEEPPAA